MRIQRDDRPAFTLVEMMVATALCLFIMAIIAQAFGAASKTFSTMRTAGQLQERLRTGTSIMRRDLGAHHFDGPFVAGRSGPRVGDQRLDLAGWMPPTRGHFQIVQAGPAIVEPLGIPTPDGEQLYSTRATNHGLRYTVVLPEAAAADLFCAEAPPNTGPGSPGAIIQSASAFNTAQPVFYGRWAEIALFLWANPPDALTTPAGMPRYSLRRRVRVLAPSTAIVAVFPANVQGQQAAKDLMDQYPDLALGRTVEQLPTAPAPLTVVKFLGPETVHNLELYPLLQFSPVQKLINGNMVETGDDILITDVISFEIKAAWARNFEFNNRDTPAPQVFGLFGSSPDSLPMFNPQTGATVNSDAPFDDLPRSVLNPSIAAGPYPRAFDTWYRASTSDSIDWDRPLSAPGTPGFLSQRNDQPPLRINVRALQIKIRVWDAKAEQARQVTLIQEI
jgi:type II secretory pathway pseudopilin PulG